MFVSSVVSVVGSVQPEVRTRKLVSPEVHVMFVSPGVVLGRPGAPVL